MKILKALLITMQIVMKLVTKCHISYAEIIKFQDAITDVGTQIERVEESFNDED